MAYRAPGAGTACPAEGVAGRHILLGITGSIAAYKAAVLCRLLRTAGAEVRVVMTPLAKQFITPLTMATLSRNPILVEFFDPENGAWNSHVSLGEWADCYLIAPATANTLAKMASGIADNLLLTTYLSARCPVVVAPPWIWTCTPTLRPKRTCAGWPDTACGSPNPPKGSSPAGSRARDAWPNLRKSPLIVGSLSPRKTPKKKASVR